MMVAGWHIIPTASTRSTFHVALLAVMVTHCSKGPLERRISELDDPALREPAIEALLSMVQKAPPTGKPQLQERVVYALCEAYREDEARSAIVSALAYLKDKRARDVFVAALQDADRGGAYYEAAVQAAKSLGELGIKEELPTLIDMLKQASSNTKTDGSSWLERALIQALDQLGDDRAIDVLLQILRGDPMRQDFYLNKLAVRALGHLKSTRAIQPLISALSSGAHGLLLYEESRQALCQIGPSARKPLLQIAQRRDHHQQAVVAVRLLGDLGGVAVAQELIKLDQPAASEQMQLVLAESLLRLGRREGEETLLRLFKSNTRSLATRRQAAELLGWYGTPVELAQLLPPICSKDDPSLKLLCWSLALAIARQGGPDSLALLEALDPQSLDPSTQSYLRTYRTRLVLARECQEDPTCYEKHLTDPDWRVVERAVLTLGRMTVAAQEPRTDPAPHDEEEPTEATPRGAQHPARAGTSVDAAAAAPEKGEEGAPSDPSPGQESRRRSEPGLLAERLAELYGGAHPQVKHAILISLEQIALEPARSKKITRLLEQATKKKAEAVKTTPPSIISRELCLIQRLLNSGEEQK